MFAVVIAPTVRADSYDERFLDGLRQRQLFSLAEKFCRERLRTMRWRRIAGRIDHRTVATLVEEALQSPPEKRDELWKQALAAVDDFAKANAQSPRLVQIRVQRGLVQLAWGELLTQELDTGEARDARLAAARDHLRQAIDELEKGLEKTAELQRRLQPARKPGPGELSTSELRSLERNTQYQLARRCAVKAKAIRWKARPGEFVDASRRTFASAAQGDVEDPLTWPARLDATTCYRLLGHLEAATRRLDKLDEDSPPPVAALRARAERMRMALAEDQVGEALALVEKGRMVDGLIAADLDLATLEVYLAAWRAAVDAGEKSQASAWQEKAAAVVRDIKRDHGPFCAAAAKACSPNRSPPILARPTSACSRKRPRASIVRANRTRRSLPSIAPCAKRRPRVRTPKRSNWATRRPPSSRNGRITPPPPNDTVRRRSPRPAIPRRPRRT